MNKKKIKHIIINLVIIITIAICTFFTIFGILETITPKQVQASHSGNTSDVQLLADRKSVV